MRYAYYEDSNEKVLTMRKVYRMFQTSVDDSQLSQGTTFRSWLDEMEHMQILNRM